MVFGPERLTAALSALEPGWRSSGFCVALSGGLDSSVLLHALAALRNGAGQPALRAVHVDHGLQAGSSGWADSSASLCRSLDVALQVIRLRLTPSPGESVEAEARTARYAAIAELLEPGEWLLTAHHRDDQMETVLIQLLRGAGVAGLAAMPSRARLGAGWHGRPLLDVDRAELAGYARQAGLAWVEDPMNSATRYDRGWLRSEILPRLRSRWPAAAATVTRSAGHLAQAARLLAELAATDAAGVVQGRRLAVEALQRLSRDRQANLLRWWIHSRGLRPPSTARLDAALDGLLNARPDAQPLVQWPEGELRRYRGWLYALRPLDDVARPTVEVTDPAACSVDLGPGCGRFRLIAGDTGGLRAPLPGPLEIRFRGGGESLWPHPARPRKRLKDLCQEAGIVPWMRERLPLLYAGGRLVAVADLWIEASFRAAPGTPAWMPVWQERPELF